MSQRFVESQRQTDPVEVTLFWSPPIVTEQQLLLLCLAAVLMVLLLLSRIAPLFIALLLSGPAVAGITWVLLWMREQKYIDKLDRALPATVGRLVAQLKSGNGIQPALEALIVDMPAGPLRAEWEFLHDLVYNVIGQDGFVNIEGLFNQMAREVPTFQGLTWAALGDRGVTVELQQPYR